MGKLFGGGGGKGMLAPPKSLGGLVAPGAKGMLAPSKIIGRSGPLGPYAYYLCTAVHTHLLTKRPGAPVAQWVKRWPTDLADRVRFSLEVKSSQP